MDFFGQSRRLRILRYVVLVPALLFTLFPIAWLLMTSLKTTRDIFSTVPQFMFEPVLTHYRAILEAGVFTDYFYNSVIVSVFTTLFSIGFGLPAAYGLARSRSRVMEGTAISMLFFRMAPPVILMVPLFFLAVQFGLSNTRVSLVLAATAFNLPFAIWLLRNYIRTSIPEEVEEAAHIDGAPPHYVFLRVVVPLVQPGIIAVGIFCFLFAWNNFIFPLALTSTPDAQTLPIAVQNAITARGVEWGKLCATTTVMLIPCVILFGFAQKYMVNALTAGSSKK